MSIIVRSIEKAAPAQDVPPAPQAPVEEKPEKAAASSPEHSAPEEKSSRQNLGQLDSETTAAETESDKDASETDTHDDHGESGEEAKADASKPKKKSGIEKRFAKLTAAKTEAQREAEYWKKVALEKGAQESKPAETKEETKPDSKSTEPDPNQFETHAEYVKAVARWAAADERRAMLAEQEKTKLQDQYSKAVQTYMDRKEAFSAKTPDFDDVISEVDDIPVSAAISQIILNSDNGPELAYQLAKNREEYARICKLPPFAAAREIGRFEAKLISKVSEEKTGTKKITSAPAPLEPVGTGGKGSVSKSIFDPNISQADYERLRMEQIKKRRQA